MNHIFQTYILLIRVIECTIELNWLCKHIKKVTNSQPAILVLSWIKQALPMSIVKLTNIVSNCKKVLRQDEKKKCSNHRKRQSVRKNRRRSKNVKISVESRLKMIAFKRYGCPQKCPRKWRGEKENCCCLITFSSKQWAFLCFVQKITLDS